jgi:nicotinic acid phosphoribosyltransferase
MSVHERTRERLSPEVFDLPVEKMRAGYYTDAYFNHARAALLQDDRHPRVVTRRSRSSSSARTTGTR